MADPLSIGLGATAIAGGIFGSRAASSSARRNIRFQEDMAKNKYKYLMQDLERAGLNPILAAQYAQPGVGGAGGGQIPYMNPIGEGITTGLQAGKVDAEKKKMEAEVQKLVKDAQKIYIEMGVLDQQRQESIAREALIKAQAVGEDLGLWGKRLDAYVKENALKGIKTIINWTEYGADITEDRKHQFNPNIPHGTYITP